MPLATFCGFRDRVGNRLANHYYVYFATSVEYEILRNMNADFFNQSELIERMKLHQMFLKFVGKNFLQ